MSRGIAGAYGSRYVSIPHFPPPRWISTARGTIRQVLMWIIVLGLGLLGIGHWVLRESWVIFTLHILSFSYMRLNGRGQHFGAGSALKLYD
jgi:hypothetical protein